MKLKSDTLEEYQIRKIKKFKSNKLVQYIISLITEKENININDLTKRTRKRHIASKRQLLMYLLQKHTNFSLDIIGYIFNKDHATVLYAKNTIMNLIDVDKNLKQKVFLYNDEITNYKNSFTEEKITTKYSLFSLLLDKLFDDDDEKKLWINAYFNAV